MEEPTGNRIQRKQLSLSESELRRLRFHIYENCFMGARQAHEQRIERFRRYYRMWRGLNVTGGSAEVGPDMQVPMLKWSTAGQWARMVQGILGDDSEVIAKPSTPHDTKAAAKSGYYVGWRLFDYMQATDEISAWLFRSILFGRGFAELNYEQEWYWERDEETGEDREVLCYDGPRLRALWPSEIIVPAADDDSQWRIRRTKLTVQQLLDGERRGRYTGIAENWRKIMAQAETGDEREYEWDDERLEADEAEGVDHRAPYLMHRDAIEVWQWYGNWRLPKGKRDSVPNNLEYRSAQESELLVTYLPGADLVVGVEDRRDIFPRLRKRDPFLDMRTLKDGSNWPPGFGEMLEDIQNESTINHALFRKAGMLSVGPIIFYRPSSNSFDPEKFEYDPFTAYPSESPQDVNAVTLKGDLTYLSAMSSTLKAMAELVTGVSDQTLGQAIDRPNAPRTAAGQAMLLQEGNTRVALDMRMVREDLSRMLQYLWQLDSAFADDDAPVFFRVTGEDAGGLFDVDNGFGRMTSEEREHTFQFDFKFATSVYSRETKKQGVLQLYGLSMQNPIVATNPRALWVLLNRMWEAFGETDFEQIIPEPPEMDRPRSVKEEWLQMMQGETAAVHPLDDDVAHLGDHRKRLQQAMAEEPDRRDFQLENMAAAHIIEHEKQRRQKMLIERLAGAAMQQIQEAQGAMGLPQGPGAMPGAAPPPNGAPGISPNGPALTPGLPAVGGPPPGPGGSIV